MGEFTAEQTLKSVDFAIAEIGGHIAKLRVQLAQYETALRLMMEERQKLLQQ